MKIRGVYTFSNKTNISPVDRWRIKYPLEELAKNTDHDIGFQYKFLHTDDKLDMEDVEKALMELGENDIVYHSYFSNRSVYAFTRVARDKTGAKFVCDIDDNLWQVDKANPFWASVDKESAWNMQVVVRDSDWVTTTNEVLAEEIRDVREKDGKDRDTVIVLPNYIKKDLYEHDEFDNGDTIKIGYFGGSSHYADLNQTGFSDAVARIMHKYKNVRFELYGWWGVNKKQGEIGGSYLESNMPTKRTLLHKGARGDKWYELFKEINLDIACGPLVGSRFNQGKSDIKWQEASLMGAAFIATDTGPYARTIKHGVDGHLVKNNTTSWYAGLEQLIEDATYRKKIAKQANKRVNDDFLLENNWKGYDDAFRRIQAA